jgi:hypothetical protein
MKYMAISMAIPRIPMTCVVKEKQAHKSGRKTERRPNKVLSAFQKGREVKLAKQLFG